ncbi:hypothetical protein PLAN_10040 [Planktothrix rubescens CCAP 1459/22]|uniref:Uncharacterized protein n=1 Tax=Planktothrix rubescens CCAP 1459/22 TaxID=329571 RepID=A0A6J7ZE76_PLARU|nr:hypothetical protein PLAN_10040 [Planktothrix rubescens NIVA-CYA 18]
MQRFNKILFKFKQIIHKVVLFPILARLLKILYLPQNPSRI